MVNRVVSIVFLLLFLHGIVQAQDRMVTGTVATDSNTAISHAYIMLSNDRDSSLVSFTQSDLSGKFKLAVTSGQPYLLKVSHIGYITKNIRIVVPKDSNLSLDTIQLKAMDVQLMEIVVKAAKAPLRMNGDTLEYDISQFKVPPGTDVEGLLKRLPGIKVDQHGNVMAQGKLVDILVNGKKFFSGNTQMATKNLLADMLTTVQVYDDKTEFSRLTGLDDGQRAKKLNLKLKELYSKMTFGQVYGGMGHPGRYEGKISVNRFSDKQQLSILGFSNNINQHSVGYQEYENFYGRRLTNVAVFGPATTSFLSYGLPNLIYTGNPNSDGDTRANGIGANYNRFGKKTKLTTSYYHNKSDMAQENQEILNFILPGNSYNQESSSIRKLMKRGHQLSSNIEHDLTAKTKWVINAGLNLSKDDNQLNKIDKYFDKHMALVSDGDQNEKNISSNDHYYVTTLLNHRLKKKGASMSVSSTYKANIGSNPIFSQTEIRFFQPKDSLSGQRQLIETKQNNRHLTGGVLYGQNIKPHLVLQSYANYSFSKANANYHAQDIHERFASTDTSLVNAVYTINFSRVGTQLSLYKKKVSLTAGLYGQSFWLNGESTYLYKAAENNKVSSNFWNVSPNLSLNYSFGKFTTTASYLRTLNSPSFQEIQPFRFANDPRNIIMGNPELLGALKDEFNIYLTGFFDKSFTQIYVGSQLTKNRRDIVQSRDVTEDLVSTFKYVNVSKGSSLIMYSGFNRPLLKKSLVLDVTYAFSRYLTFTPVNSQPIHTLHFMHQPTVNLSWSLKKLLYIAQGVNLISNIYRYSLDGEPDQKMLRFNITSSLNIRLPGEIFVSGKLDLVSNRSRSTSFNQTLPILYASINRSFFKGHPLALRLSAHDILNRRQDISLSSYQNVISVRRSSILSRYYMMTLVYNIRGVRQNIKSL